MQFNTTNPNNSFVCIFYRVVHIAIEVIAEIGTVDDAIEAHETTKILAAVALTSGRALKSSQNP